MAGPPRGAFGKNPPHKVAAPAPLRGAALQAFQAFPRFPAFPRGMACGWLPRHHPSAHDKSPRQAIMDIIHSLPIPWAFAFICSVRALTQSLLHLARLRAGSPALRCELLRFFSPLGDFLLQDCKGFRAFMLFLGVDYRYCLSSSTLLSSSQGRLTSVLPK